MKNKIIGSIMALSLVVASASSVMASTVTHTVYPGDTMWRISMVHNLKLDSVTKLNPQVKNPDLIYPGDDIILDLTRGGKSKLSATLPVPAQAQAPRIINNFLVGKPPVTAKPKVDVEQQKIKKQTSYNGLNK